MRVCYFGTYDLNYSRNRILIEGLRRNGVEVVECHAPLWQGTNDKVSVARNGWRRPEVVFRAARAYLTLLRQTHRLDDCNVLIHGYMGQFDAFLGRLVANRCQIPLVLDLFMTIGLVVRERQLAQPGDFLDRTVGWIERRASLLADMVWLDTPLHLEYFQQRYQAPSANFRLLPIGADDRFFFPVPDAEAGPDQPFTVSYVGKYVPVHGVPTILRAAAQLRDEGVRFKMIGEGDAKPAAVALAQRLDADNVEFVGWVEKTELVHRMAAADVCLGIFGGQRAGMITVPNKIYEGLAVRKPVITARTPSSEAAFESGRHLLLVPPEDPTALADAIRRLRDDAALRERLATEGYRLYRECYTPTAIGALAVGHLRELLDGWELGQPRP